MDITREDRKNGVVLHLKGEVDMRTSPALRQQLLALATDKTAHVVVSLERVRYIDSSGVATLIECLKNVGRYKGKFTLVGVNDDIYPVFELAHLNEVFDLHRDGSIDEAL